MEELIAIQSELKVPKDRRNAEGDFNYRSCEDILAAVKPLLSRYKCLLLLSDEVTQVGERYYIEASATITNQKGVGVTAKASAREPESKDGMDASQVTGTASSYARKYALSGLLALDDVRDSDMTNNAKQGSAKIAETAKRKLKENKKGKVELP